MTDLKLKIDKSKCVQCGMCVKDCSCAVLELDKTTNFPKVAEGGELRCMKCQHCFSICPTGALSILGKNPEKSELPQKNYPEDILNLIKSRKSIRQLKAENISKEDFEKLKEMLPWIPTGCNDHRLLFTFIDDIDLMNNFKNLTYQKLKELYSKNPYPKEAMKLLRLKDAFLAGNDVIFRNAPHAVIVSSPDDAPCAETDPVIALSYFELYANALGLATVWCGLMTYTLKVFPDLVKELKIPQNYKPVYCMLFGKPAVSYKRITQPEKYRIMTYGKTLEKFYAFLKKIKTSVINFVK